MLLTKFISKDHIVAELKATSKTAAIEELARLLFREQHEEELAPVLDQVMAREALESTGIGRGIAVPHARVAGLEHLVCAVGRVKEGIEFKALDRKPVRLIFLVCYPPAHQTTYLNFIATLAKLLQNDMALDPLLEATTAEEVFERLSDIATTLVKPEELPPKKGDSLPGSPIGTEAPGAVILLARLELCTEMLESAQTGRDDIEQRIENISTLLDPKLLSYYHRIKKMYRNAVVAVEGGICQGCMMKLPSQLTQSMLQDRSRVECCTHCHRFVCMT